MQADMDAVLGRHEEHGNGADGDGHSKSAFDMLSAPGLEHDGTSSPSSTSVATTTNSPTPFPSVLEKALTPLSINSDCFQENDLTLTLSFAAGHPPKPQVAQLGEDATPTKPLWVDQLPPPEGTAVLRLHAPRPRAPSVSPALQHYQYHQLVSLPENSALVQTASPLSAGIDSNLSRIRDAVSSGGATENAIGLGSVDTHQQCDTTNILHPLPQDTVISPTARQPTPPQRTTPHLVRGSEHDTRCPSSRHLPFSDNSDARDNPNNHPRSSSPNTNSSSPTSSSRSSVISQLRQHLLQCQRDGNPLATPKPLIRTTSDNTGLAIRHPVPDLNTRSGACLGNIAQLEATAERLSTTSSIEDAIRELHSELKRSDSQRSSLRAASILAESVDESRDTSSLVQPVLSRHLSTSSIVSRRKSLRTEPRKINIPSPSHSLKGRLRSHSKNSGRVEMDFETYLSRTGPGKSSVRSIQSGKLSLAEIAESEPVSLTLEAMDEADRAALTDEDDDTIRPPREPEVDAPNTDAFHMMLDESALESPAPDLRLGEPSDALEVPRNDVRPGTAGSAASWDPTQAFGDFDGVHCDPELYVPPAEPEYPPQMSPPQVSPPLRPPLARPKSYVNPETGQQMLFYPARVPMMLNLPPKLSKKPKAAERNDRRSRILSAMAMPMPANDLAPEPAPVRASWLPDPLEGLDNSPFSPMSQQDSPLSELVSPPGEPQQPLTPEIKEPDAMARGPESPDKIESDLEIPAAVPRPRASRLIDPDARMSRLSTLPALPPQLRASVYFDLPSTTPSLEVKNGSAMDTLDSLLDASANAPVSAFTDHAIAGKLGAEVYGPEKRRKSAVLDKRPNSAVMETKKRSTFFLRSKKSTETLDQDRRSKSITGVPISDAVPIDEDLPEHAVGVATLKDEDDDSSEDGAEVYQGPPTTLLAELQIRKQQQKIRTRPINQAFPNGMHTTLLELDAVREEERKNRKGKRVNLAWEDPAFEGPIGESDDEDVPLGVIMAAKKTGNNDLAAVSADINRPLGLMERRDMEDNEPLSRRRARLQGQDPRQMDLAKRQTMISLARMSQMPDYAQPEPEVEEEVEDETLGERMRRLKAADGEECPLPRARPVSGAFTAELLSQFGDAEDEKKEKEKAEQSKAKAAVAAGQDGEEEETLGQRRRRLQAEREARGREMAFAAPATRIGLGPVALEPRPMSMASLLGAHPKREVSREVEEQRRREEELRASQVRDDKLAAMRSQMPAALSSPNLNNPGGFRGGKHNDGAGGMGIKRAPSPNFGVAPGFGTSPDAWNRSSMAFSGYGVPLQQPAYGQYGGAYVMNGAGYGAPMSYGAAPVQMSMPMGQYPQQPMQMPMGAGMQNPTGTGQTDMVERWRQSVMP